MRNPTQLWLPKTLMQAETSAGVRAMINARTFPKRRAKKGLELRCWTHARWGAELCIPERAGMVGIYPRKMLGLAGSGVGAVPPSCRCRRLCQPSSRRLGAAPAHTGLSRWRELMFTPHRPQTSLTSPTSAVIIRESEQMAAELAEKRKISYTAAACCEQVLPTSARREDDGSCHQRGICSGAAATTSPKASQCRAGGCREGSHKHGGHGV